MFKVDDLFSSRFSRTLGEWLRYGKYILNGHLMIVLLFLIGYVAFSYQKWLQVIPSNFPVSEIVTVVIAVVVTYSSIFTYLLNADRVFLLPLETKMKRYFNKALIFSMVGHVFLVFLALGIFMPLLQITELTIPFVYLLGCLTLLKLVNLLLRWYIQYDVNTRMHRVDQFGRFILNIVAIYFLLTNRIVIFSIVVILFLAICIVYYYSYHNKGIKWDFLIDLEENRMMKFYRFANMFAEVPHLKNEVKRRKYLDVLLTLIPYKPSAVYTNLYMRAFLRSGDYFGLVVRLTIISLLFIAFVNNLYGILIFQVLFIFLTAFQLIGLWNHFDYNLFTSIYPIDEKDKSASFLKVYQYVLFIQTLVMGIVVAILHFWLAGVYAFALGIVFIVLYTRGYVKRKLN